MQAFSVYIYKGLLKISLISDFVVYVKFNALPLVINVSDMFNTETILMKQMQISQV